MPPVTNPVPVTTAGAGNLSFVTSGVSPASGVSGTGSLSGPFWIQEQTMKYDYVRVPLGSLSSVVISLSGSTWTGVHTGTVLIVRCKATVSSRKSYEWFETSAYTQSQKFAVEAASADMFGNTYCNMAASACILSSLSGTYMVAGQVYTYQPWYRRRPWLDGQDTENNSTEVGYNYQAYDDNGPLPDHLGNNAQDAEKVWADYHSIFATETIDGTNGLTALLKFGVAEKAGIYHYGQDDDNDIMYNTDMMGSVWPMGTYHDQFGAQVSIFAYDHNRHDWS
jgi:hypothetical protein